MQLNNFLSALKSPPTTYKPNNKEAKHKIGAFSFMSKPKDSDNQKQNSKDKKLSSNLMINNSTLNDFNKFSFLNDFIIKGRSGSEANQTNIAQWNQSKFNKGMPLSQRNSIDYQNIQNYDKRIKQQQQIKMINKDKKIKQQKPMIDQNEQKNIVTSYDKRFLDEPSKKNQQFSENQLIKEKPKSDNDRKKPEHKAFQRTSEKIFIDDKEKKITKKCDSKKFLQDSSREVSDSREHLYNKQIQLNNFFNEKQQDSKIYFQDSKIIVQDKNYNFVHSKQNFNQSNNFENNQLKLNIDHQQSEQQKKQQILQNKIKEGIQDNYSHITQLFKKLQSLKKLNEPQRTQSLAVNNINSQKLSNNQQFDLNHKPKTFAQIVPIQNFQQQKLQQKVDEVHQQSNLELKKSSTNSVYNKIRKIQEIANKQVQNIKQQTKNTNEFYNSQLSTNTFTKCYSAQEKISRQSFDFQYVVGMGGFGKVWKVQYKNQTKNYAMKEMSKLKIIYKHSVNSVLNEKNLLSTLKHNFIVNIILSFQDKENLYLVMDLMTGGDLRYHIGIQRKFNENQTQFFIACILIGLEYLHQKQIIHRDIKPENLVLEKSGYIRITDLGIARIYKSQNSSDTSGTPGYMAPEVICRQNHGLEADFFAVGVIAYECLMGKRPYLGSSRQEIKEAILQSQAQIRPFEAGQFSREAVDFINKMLQRKPMKRLGYKGIEEVMGHPWFQDFPWQLLKQKKLQSPFIPNPSKDNFDESQFSQTEYLETDMQEQNHKIINDPNVQDCFRDYSFENLDY